jgi:hypothetical protein
MATDMTAKGEKTKRWLQMGAELEGSWVRSRKNVAAEVRGARAHDDRSVHIGHGDPGEIVTRPHDTLDGLLKDIDLLWPDTINDSCGFHVHASFTPLDGSIIATRDFYTFFKDEWSRWGHQMGIEKNHEFWTRLAGRNKFAKDTFDPETQLKGAAGRSGDARYTILNFHAWEKHKTIECRLLPMFANKEVAFSAVRNLASIYDTYLSTHGFSTITLEPSISVIGDVVVEEYDQKMPSITPKFYEAEGKFPHLPVGDDLYYAIDGAMDLVAPHATVLPVNKYTKP